ncbi:MAG: winged helix-turn-helix transcriptional regulator [Candidatus Heimdallarchaeota archaeon]
MPNRGENGGIGRNKNKKIYLDSSQDPLIGPKIQYINPRFRDALSVIPLIFREIFIEYFTLTQMEKSLSEASWKEHLGLCSFSSYLNPSSPHSFERNPFTYLIKKHNSLVDLPSALNRILKTLHFTRNGRKLTREQFLILLDKICAEADKKNWLTPTLRKVVQARMKYPLASTKELAKRLRVSENTVRYNTERFKNRFNLDRTIKWDYYKLGLSRIYLFLIFFDRTTLENAIPLTNRYFECEIPHKMDIAHNIFSIQISTPPKNRWKTFQTMCETRFDEKRVRWFPESPTFFYIEEGIYSYNLDDTYNKQTKQWMIDEEYIDFCLSTDLIDDLPEVEFPPNLTMQFDVNCKREQFDELDLKIIKFFYELEGNDNRFSTITGVAKQIGVAKQTVKKRFERLLKKGIIKFFFITNLRLPRIINVVLLTKKEKIIKNYLKLTMHVPFAAHARIRAYRKKIGYIGVHSSLYVPCKTNLAYILRDSLLSRDDVLGFCSDCVYTTKLRRHLIDYWDSIRSKWKWSTLPS